jgi:RHS repeat-associated protein
MDYNGGWSAQYRFLLTDHQGSVVSTADFTGYIMPFMNYSAWGELGTLHAGLNYAAPPEGSPFGYTGREWGAETGLWQCRARYYSPRLGQFLSDCKSDEPRQVVYASFSSGASMRGA